MSSKKLQDTFPNKTLLVQVIFIALIVGGVLFFEFFFKGPSMTDNEVSGEATLLIDFDNMQRMFTGEVVDGMTILDALNASVAVGQIKLKYHVDRDNNTEVKEINNHTANENIQFTFYVNSRKIDLNTLNKTYIQPGDMITIRLE